MTTPIFHSDLTPDEIERNFQDTDLFAEIMESLREIIEAEDAANQDQPDI